MRDWKWAALLCSVALGSGPAWAADVLTKAPVRQSYVSPNGDFTLIYDQQVRYVTWESTRGYPTFGSTAAGSGQQLYSPFSLELKSRQHRDWAFDVLVRG